MNESKAKAKEDKAIIRPEREAVVDSTTVGVGSRLRTWIRTDVVPLRGAYRGTSGPRKDCHASAGRDLWSPPVPRCAKTALTRAS